MKPQLLNHGKAILLSAALIGATATSLSVVATEAGYDNPIEKQQVNQKRQHKKFKRLARFLALTDVQQVKIKEIRAEGKAQQQAHREAIKAFKKAKANLSKADVLDEQALLDLFAENRDTLAQAALAKIKIQHAIRQVLTQEQRVKWQKHQKRTAKKGNKLPRGISPV